MIENSGISRSAHVERVFIDLAVESLRLIRAFEKIIGALDEQDARRYASKIRFFRRNLDQGLEESGFSLVEPTTGDVYDPGMAVSAINCEDFEPEDELVIDTVLEPIIMSHDGSIKRLGSVIVRKAQS